MEKPSKPSKTRRGGRQPGTPNLDRRGVVLIAPRCPACGSTDRAPYDRRYDCHVEQGGTAPDGQVYTHIVIRRTRCLACGQALTHREYRNGCPGKK